MTQQDAILQIMHFWAVGSKNAKKRDFLLEKINKLLDKKDHLTDRAFRKLYARMSADHLLGSDSTEGYFWITGKEDLAIALSALDKAAEAISIRKNMIFSRYEDKYGVTDRQRDFAI